MQHINSTHANVCETVYQSTQSLRKMNICSQLHINSIHVRLQPRVSELTRTRRPASHHMAKFARGHFFPPYL